VTGPTPDPVPLEELRLRERVRRATGPLLDELATKLPEGSTLALLLLVPRPEGELLIVSSTSRRRMARAAQQWVQDVLKEDAATGGGNRG